jgi:hypothetical protein
MKHLTPSVRFFVFLFGFLCLCNPARAAYEWAGLQWSPTLSIDETYDSNVTFAPTDEHEDFITAIAPGFEAVAEGKTQTISLTGHLHEKIYANESDFNNFSQDLSGLYKKEFSEYNITASPSPSLYFTPTRPAVLTTNSAASPDVTILSRIFFPLHSPMIFPAS